MWRNYRLSLSFANLVYLRAWADLIPLRSSGLFHRKNLPGMNLYFALVADVLALSLLIFLVLSLVPKLPVGLRQLVRRALPVAALAMTALATSFLRTHLLHYLPARALTLGLGIAFLIAAGLALRFSEAAIRITTGIVLAATPCLAVTFIAPLFYLNSPSPLPPDPPLARSLPATPPVRVIWLIFDDWDQRLTFDAPGVAAPVPTLFRLATHSFAANHALAALTGTVPVFDMSTNSAIPSLLYGKLMVGSAIEGPATRQLLFAGSDTLTVFGQGDSIFARMRAQGWNSAVAGWFIPYCRIFAPVLTGCYWDEMFDQASSAHTAPLAAAVDETRMLFETDMFSLFGRSLVDERHIAEFESLLTASKRYAADPTLGLAFVHFNVPHMPFFYNPELGRFGRSGHPDDLYIDALKWVDLAVQETISSLEKSGLNAKTAVILSADHPARLVSQTSPYVPFIVHLPGQEAGLFETREFSALRTADLVLAIARGEVQSPEDVAKLLTRAP
jgi:hypothetical protein